MGLLEQQQQLVDEMNGEGLQVPADIEPLDFLLAIMRDPRQPMARRQKAATDAAQYRHPKLGAVATLSMSSNDFAAMLDRAIARSGKRDELVELKAIDVTPQIGNSDDGLL